MGDSARRDRPSPIHSSAAATTASGTSAIAKADDGIQTAWIDCSSSTRASTARRYDGCSMMPSAARSSVLVVWAVDRLCRQDIEELLRLIGLSAVTEQERTPRLSARWPRIARVHARQRCRAHPGLPQGQVWRERRVRPSAIPSSSRVSPRSKRCWSLPRAASCWSAARVPTSATMRCICGKLPVVSCASM